MLVTNERTEAAQHLDVHCKRFGLMPTGAALAMSRALPRGGGAILPVMIHRKAHAISGPTRESCDERSRLGGSRGDATIACGWTRNHASGRLRAAQRARVITPVCGVLRGFERAAGTAARGFDHTEPTPKITVDKNPTTAYAYLNS